jgi:hypothetical protein
LTNNLDSLYNNSQKRIKNLNINCILAPKNKRDLTLIYFYNFVIYINIKLCELKFTKDINTYEELFEYINNIDIDLNKYELCRGNLKKIFTLSEYICYFGKFQTDIIDLRLSEIFLDVENEIKNNIINGKDFDAILNYIYNSIFNKNDNNISFSLEEKTINEINEECEMRSFLDYSDGIQENLIKNNYENKLKINDSFENFCKSKESMVNLEGLLLRELFNNKDLFKYYKLVEQYLEAIYYSDMISAYAEGNNVFFSFSIDLTRPNQERNLLEITHFVNLFVDTLAQLKYSKEVKDKFKKNRIMFERTKMDSKKRKEIEEKEKRDLIERWKLIKKIKTKKGADKRKLIRQLNEMSKEE